MNRYSAFQSPAILCLIGGLTLSGLAHAQAPVYSTAVPGVCLLGRDNAIGLSLAGKAGTAKMKQLQAGIAEELKPQEQAIERDNTALTAQQRTLAPAVYQQRQADLRKRAQALQQLNQVRGAQLQRTKALAEQQIATAMEPAVAAAVSRNHCAVLFERASTYGSAEAMDITTQVVQDLDRRLPSVEIALAPPSGG